MYMYCTYIGISRYDEKREIMYCTIFTVLAQSIVNRRKEDEFNQV